MHWNLGLLPRRPGYFLLQQQDGKEPQLCRVLQQAGSLRIERRRTRSASSVKQVIGRARGTVGLHGSRQQLLATVAARGQKEQIAQGPNCAH